VRAPGNSSCAFEAALFAARRSDLREWYCPQARIAPLNAPTARSVSFALRLSLSSVARSPHTASAAFSQGGENAPATHPKKPSRSWRVIIIRSKGEHLGSVEAPGRERAEAVAIKEFALDETSAAGS
jgi:hypothetical protein